MNLVFPCLFTCRRLSGISISQKALLNQPSFHNTPHWQIRHLTTGSVLRYTIYIYTPNPQRISRKCRLPLLLTPLRTHRLLAFFYVPSISAGGLYVEEFLPF